LKINNNATFGHLKAMNKKFAFTVVQKGPRKMAIEMADKSSNATIVSDSFYLVTGLTIQIYGLNIQRGSRPINSCRIGMVYPQKRLSVG
jgi:hypothetical protein